MYAWRVAVAALVISACRGEPTLLVVNTSGVKQVVHVGSTNFEDHFVTDTIPSGESWCWAVPQLARRQVLVLVRVPELHFAAYDLLIDAGGFLHRSWGDSLPLDRSWQVHVRQEHFVQASASWKQRWERRWQQADSALVTRAFTYEEWLDERPRFFSRSEWPEVMRNTGRFEPTVEAAHSGDCNPGKRPLQ